MKKKLNLKECMKYAAMGPHKKNGEFMEQIGLLNAPPVNISVTTESILNAFEELMDWEYNKKKHG